METKSIKLTHNAPNSWLICIIFESIMKQYKSPESASVATAIVKHLEYYAELLKEFSSSDPEKRIIIDEAEHFCAKSDTFKNYYHLVIQALYKFDVIHGSHIIEWGMRTKQEIDNADAEGEKKPNNVLKEDEQDDDQNDMMYDDELDEDEIDVETRKKFLASMEKFLKHLDE